MALVLGAFSYVFAQLTRPEPTFQATAAVRVERMATAAGLLTELFSVSPGDNLATQAALIRGFPVLERAAKRLGRLPADIPSDQVRSLPRYQQIITALQAQVQTEQEGNTNIIRIAVTAREGAEAARAANAVAEAFREENTASRSRQVREAKQFIEVQLAEVEGRLRASEERLRTLKERHGFVSLGEETAASLSRVAALEADGERARRARDEVAALLRQVQEGQVAGPARAGTETADPALARLTGALADLRLQRENLLLTLTPRHPQVLELDAQIENARVGLLRELEARLRSLAARADELEVRVRRARAQHQAIPEVALELARAQREVKVNEDLFALLKTKHQEAQIREKDQVEEVSIVRPATEPAGPSNPTDWLTKLVAGLAVGLLLGLVMAFTVESLDTSIGTIEDVEGFLAVPVMGLIPDIGPEALAIPGAAGAEREAQPFLIALQNPSSTIGEAYRSLRTNLDFVAVERQVKTICVTSASRTEGKSTTAINLAITMAQMGRKTLLVEADLRKPFLHFAFGIPKEPGLAEAILGVQPWTGVVRTVTDLMLGRLGLDQIMGAPNIDQLHLITSGAPPTNPAEFLNSTRMTELVAAFREQFDIVIFDCAPVLPVTDAAILASKTDGTLLVHRVGTIARAALRRAKTLLENVRGRVVGVVLTGLKAEISPDFEELEYYRYGYGEAAAAGTPERGPGSRGGGGRARRRALFSSKVLLAAAAAAALAGIGAWYALAQLGAGASVLEPGLVTRPALTPRHPSPAPAGPPSPEEEPSAMPESAAPAGPQTVPGPADPRGTSGAPPAGPAPVGSPSRPPASSPGAMSLQVAAFREPARAQTYVEELRGKGLGAFAVPTEVPGKGRWVRVFVGHFPSQVAAEASRARLPRDRAAGAKARRLPYAVQSGPLPTYERAAAVVGRARELGYAPTVLTGTGPAGRPHYRVVVEAFPTPHAARAAARQLEAAEAHFRPVVR